MAKAKTEKQDIPNGEEVVGTGNDARLKLMDEINDRNDEELAGNGDLRDIEEDGSTSEFASTEEKTDEQVTEEELQRAEQEANAEHEEEHEEPIQKHKIKVNGKEVELTTQELIERAQKIEAADEYLRTAADKLRDAEVKASKPIPASTQPSREDVEAEQLEKERAIVRAIQMGSEEEAMAAIKQIRGNTPSFTEDDINRQIEARLAFNTAVSRFKMEYSDLWNDKRLLAIVTNRDNELMAAGDVRDYWDRYKQIGDEVRAWRDSLAKPDASKKPESTDKVQRKASATTVPKGAGAKAPQAADEEDREESPSEIISAMAKSRGGPQWLRG